MSSSIFSLNASQEARRLKVSECRMLTSFWITWIERNRRILMIIQGLCQEELSDRISFCSAIWASVSLQFRHYSPSALKLDWKAAVTWLMLLSLSRFFLSVLSSLRLGWGLLVLNCTLVPFSNKVRAFRQVIYHFIWWLIYHIIGKLQLVIFMLWKCSYMFSTISLTHTTYLTWYSQNRCLYNISHTYNEEIFWIVSVIHIP